MAGFVVLMIMSVYSTLFLSSTHAQPSASLILDGINFVESGISYSDQEKLYAAHKIFERAIQEKDANEALAYYYLGYTQYQLAIYLIAEGERSQAPLLYKDSAQQYIDLAIDNLKESIDFDKKSEVAAEAHALLSMAYGQKIRMNPKPLNAMMWGMRSSRSVRRSANISPENPRVILANGINKLNTPESFGGSQEEALDSFRHAVNLFAAQNSSPLLPSWGEIEAYTWMGITHIQMEQYQHARCAFEKTLHINPNYNWVKYGILPSLESEGFPETNPELCVLSD